MKTLTLTSSAIFGTFTFFSSAYAVCPDNATITVPSVLVGSTVCVVGESQEFHQGGGTSGDLIDYKKGAADPVDPTTSVGSWSISGNNITYNYGGTAFTYTYHQNSPTDPGRYCNISTNAEFIIAEIIPGLNQCTWAAP